MKKNQITSLTLLNSSDIIIEQKENSDEKSFYIIHQMNQDEEKTEFNLIQINEHFTKLGITVPNEANKDGIFISKNDPDFTLRLFKAKFTKKELSEILIKHIR